MRESTKVMSLSHMVSQFIKNSSQVYIDGILANRLPMAIIHEIIRQGQKDLRIVSAPNGIAVDQLVGAGCVEEVEFYFLGLMTQQGFATMRQIRTAVETGLVRIKESMGYAICMALRAGAFGIPFIPLPDFRGSDLLKVRDDYKILVSPYNSQDTVVLVPALRPDLLVLHAHKADTRGNVVLEEPWPDFTLTTAQACHQVIVTVEEIVEERIFNPREITIPHFLVNAIALTPFGAAPTALNHYYETNQNHIAIYQQAAQTEEGFQSYLQEYILAPKTHAGFLKKAGFPPDWISTQKGFSKGGKSS